MRSSSQGLEDRTEWKRGIEVVKLHRCREDTTDRICHQAMHIRSVLFSRRSGNLDNYVLIH